MNIKKERNHLMGMSNIDFRSSGEIDKAKLYCPWYYKKDYGTMGYERSSLKPKEFKFLMRPSANLNTQKDISNERPNAMYHDTAKFYYKSQVKIKPITMNENERVGELNNSFKGGEVFCGDSMMIASNNKLRKQRA